MQAGALIRELTLYQRGCAKLARAGRRFLELVHVEAAQDIVSELAAAQHDLAKAAHSAEVMDREALVAIDAATRPNSEGGRAITPKELAKVRRCVARSAELDHDIAEAASV